MYPGNWLTRIIYVKNISETPCFIYHFQGIYLEKRSKKLRVKINLRYQPTTCFLILNFMFLYL